VAVLPTIFQFDVDGSNLEGMLMQWLFILQMYEQDQTRKARGRTVETNKDGTYWEQRRS